MGIDFAKRVEAPVTHLYWRLEKILSKICLDWFFIFLFLIIIIIMIISFLDYGIILICLAPFQIEVKIQTMAAFNLSRREELLKFFNLWANYLPRRTGFSRWTEG